MKRRGLSIGGRLLLFSSVLLALPWLGYRYLEEMKAFLIQGQEEAQTLAVRAVATVLHDRPEWFDVSAIAGDTWLADNALYAYPLASSIQIDGYAADWGRVLERKKHYGPESTVYTRSGGLAASAAFDLVLGERGAFLYGFVRVADDKRVYRHPGYRSLDRSDHLRLAWFGADGVMRRIVLVTEGPGTVSAYEVDANWRYPTTGEALPVRGEWHERGRGYDVEFRIPAEWLHYPQRLGVSVVDVDDAGERPVEAVVATVPKAWSQDLNRLIVRAPELERIIQGLGRSDARICVVDRYGRVRAVLGGQDTAGDLCADTDRIGQELFEEALAGRQNLLHRRDAQSGEHLIVAAHPIYAGDQVMGTVLLEKNSARILDLKRDTLSHVALATFAVLLLVVAGLLSFGAWLTFRIRRLKRAAGAAIDADGRIVKSTLDIDRAAGDDLVDLSRTISGLLARLKRYTGFLETVPRTLRHEILNPVNTISMTLEKLSQRAGGGETAALVKSAQQAARQLELIVNSLTEAAHIEDALKQDAPAVFDLAELVREYVANSAALNAGANLVYDGPPTGVYARGSDVRIAQLMDKVKDNALDFACGGSAIRFVLEKNCDWVSLSVRNQGPRVPAQVLEALFAGMAPHRPATEGRPHLGMGLFIAHRIAEHHGGQLQVANRQHPTGVDVTLRIPIAASV
jgi:signal transduction histidine kinase